MLIGEGKEGGREKGKERRRKGEKEAEVAIHRSES
jgi:hypothetical protein